MDRVIEVNKKLIENSGSKIVLNKKDRLPHISLAMGVINKEDMLFIKNDLQELTGEFSIMNLEAVSIYVSVSNVSSFKVKNTKELQMLHEKVMQKLSRYFTYDAAAETLYSPSGTEESTLNWINSYPQNSAFENFLPHITIGFGKADNIDEPVKFTASKLAVCHLGSHCTCRKILASAEFKNG